MKKEAKAGLGYTVGNVLLKGISFFTVPIFTRLLTTEDFGIYNTYLAYQNVLTIIICLGLDGTIKNGYFEFKERFNNYIHTISVIQVGLTFSMMVVALFFHDSISKTMGITSAMLYILVPHSFGAGMTRVNNAKFTLKYDYKSYLGYSVFNTLANVGFSVLFVLTVFADDRSFGRALGTAIPMMILGVYIAWQNIVSNKGHFSAEFAKFSFTLGLPLMVHYLAQVVLNQMDRIMITNIQGASFTGLYSYVYSLSAMLSFVSYSLDNVWSVWVFKQFDSKNYQGLYQASKKYIMLICYLAISLMVVGNELITIMAPKSYWEGRTLLMPLVFGIFLLFLYTIPAGVEYYFKKTKYIALFTLFAAIINLVTNYIFIHSFGYRAAAYTTLFCYLIMFFGHYFASVIILKKQEIPQVYTFKEFFVAMIVMVIACLASWVLIPHPIIKYSIYILGSLVLLYREKDLVKNLVFSKKK